MLRRFQTEAGPSPPPGGSWDGTDAVEAVASLNTLPPGPVVPPPPPIQPRTAYPNAQPTDQTQTGVPVAASSVVASQQQVVSQGRTFALVTVAFDTGNDLTFTGADIWINGYKGNANWELISSTTASPGSFMVEQTGDTIQIAVASYGTGGVAPSGSAAPGTVGNSLALAGPGAPPAPTVTQTVIATPTGFQFTFSQEAGMLANVVAGYNIYRNTANNVSTATKVGHVAQDPSNTGGVVWQDVQPQGTVLYYWVTAVNTWGAESTATAANSGAVTAITPITAAGNIGTGVKLAGDTGPTVDTTVLSAVTGTQRNLVPDSEIKFLAAYWTLAAGCTVVAGASPGGGNAFRVELSANGVGAQSVTIPVIGGTQYTLSALLDPHLMTGGTLFCEINNGSDLLLLTASASASAARAVGTFTAPLSGNVTVQVGQTSSPVGAGYVSCMQMEVGSAVTAYRPNFADDVTGHLLRGAHTPELLNVINPSGQITGATETDQAGSLTVADWHARVKATIGGSGNVGIDNVLDGATYFRTTANQRDGGGRAYNTIDSGNVVVASGVDFSRGYTGKHLDNIADGTTYARPKASYLSSGVPYTFVGSWSSAPTYVIGEVVGYSGNSWLAIASNTNSAPTTSNANWQLLGPTSIDNVLDGSTYGRTKVAYLKSGVPYNFAGVWSGSGTYNPGDEVSYTGNYWLCIVANSGSAPTASNSNWQLIGPTNLDNVSDGSLRFAAAEADADKTLVHAQLGVAVGATSGPSMAVTGVVDEMSVVVNVTGGSSVLALVQFWGTVGSYGSTSTGYNCAFYVDGTSQVTFFPGAPAASQIQMFSYIATLTPGSHTVDFRITVAAPSGSAWFTTERTINVQLLC